MAHAEGVELLVHMAHMHCRVILRFVVHTRPMALSFEMAHTSIHGTLTVCGLLLSDGPLVGHGSHNLAGPHRTPWLHFTLAQLVLFVSLVRPMRMVLTLRLAHSLVMVLPGALAHPLVLVLMLILVHNGSLALYRVLADNSRSIAQANTSITLTKVVVLASLNPGMLL